MDPAAEKFKFRLLVLAGLVFYPLFFILIKLKKKRDAGEGPRILVIPQLTRIGDLVCATPVFGAIKKAYPQSHLAVLVSKKAAGILKNNPRIDELIIYEDAGFYQLLKKMRGENFDWSFSLSGTALSSLLAFLSLIPNRAKTIRSPKPASEILTDWLNNFRIPYRHHTYLPKHHLKLLEFLGIKNSEEQKEVFTSGSSEEKAKIFFREKGISENDFLVGMSISAGNKNKEWPSENFKELAQFLAQKYGAKIIFFGSPADEQRIDGVLSGLKNGNYFKAVDPDLENLPSLIKRMKLFIAADTGPIHVAHALKIPLVDIIGPVDPDELVPSGKNTIAVKPEIPPSIFSFKKAGRLEDQRRAIDSIKIEKVKKAVEELIEKSRILF